MPDYTAVLMETKKVKFYVIFFNANDSIASVQPFQAITGLQASKMLPLINMADRAADINHH